MSNVRQNIEAFAQISSPDAISPETVATLLSQILEEDEGIHEQLLDEFTQKLNDKIQQSITASSDKTPSSHAVADALQSIRVCRNGVNPYTNITLPVDVIPKGSIIINLSEFPLICFSSAELTNRVDIGAKDAFVTSTDITVIRSGAIDNGVSNTAEFYICRRKISSLEIADSAVTQNKIAHAAVTADKIASESVTNNALAPNAVTPDKTDFIASHNLINLQAPGYMKQHYIAENGNIYPNSTLNLTDFIPVKPGNSYVFSNAGTKTDARFIAFFAVDKSFISSEQYINTISSMPQSAAFIRISFSSDHEFPQLEIGLNPTDFKPYQTLFDNKLIKNIDSVNIAQNGVTADNIDECAVDIKNTTFFESKNLIDETDPEFLRGKYMAALGQILSSDSYDLSGFIRVSVGESYFYSTVSYQPRTMRFVSFFDKDKNYLGCVESVKLVSEMPEGTKFIRVSIYNADTQRQLERGTSASAYAPFKKTIPQSLIAGGTPEIYLPKHIYVAVGRTIEIYHSQVVLNPHKWNIQFICDCGLQLKRKFQIKGADSIIGDHTLTMNVFNDALDIVASQTAVIHIVKDNIKAPVKILPIGDSHSNGKAWISELSVLNNFLSTVGTRSADGMVSEGRSGKGFSFYNNVDGSEKYTYLSNYVGVGSDAAEFSTSQSYNSGQYVKRTLNGFASYYRFVKAHNPGAWNDSEVVNISDTNPFWNYENNSFSLKNYRITQGINFDIITVWLGTNGISLYPEYNTQGAAGAKMLVDNIRAELPDIPIVFINTPFPGNQDGLGRQTSNDGYASSSDEFKYRADLKIMRLERALHDVLKDYDNVYICPVAATMDSENAYTNTDNAIQPVNPRLTDTSLLREIWPQEAVHPQKHGYLQAADQIYSTLCAILK